MGSSTLVTQDNELSLDDKFHVLRVLAVLLPHRRGRSLGLTEADVVKQTALDEGGLWDHWPSLRERALLSPVLLKKGQAGRMRGDIAWRMVSMVLRL